MITMWAQSRPAWWGGRRGWWAPAGRGRSTARGTAPSAPEKNANFIFPKNNREFTWRQREHGNVLKCFGKVPMCWEFLLELTKCRNNVREPSVHTAYDMVKANDIVITCMNACILFVQCRGHYISRKFFGWSGLWKGHLRFWSSRFSCLNNQ